MALGTVWVRYGPYNQTPNLELLPCTTSFEGNGGKKSKHANIIESSRASGKSRSILHATKHGFAALSFCISSYQLFRFGLLRLLGFGQILKSLDGHPTQCIQRVIIHNGAWFDDNVVEEGRPAAGVDSYRGVHNVVAKYPSRAASHDNPIMLSICNLIVLDIWLRLLICVNTMSSDARDLVAMDNGTFAAMNGVNACHNIADLVVTEQSAACIVHVQANTTPLTSANNLGLLNATVAPREHSYIALFNAMNCTIDDPWICCLQNLDTTVGAVNVAFRNLQVSTSDTNAPFDAQLGNICSSS
mmetsp:Transcript_35191/g.59000  ORF Transcript_35191/g.59000 Transcript_35191/m.59000 type:complete len:301 (-) Transcript_35191:336-1238(-)